MSTVKLFTLEEKARQILEAYPDARDSDEILAYHIYNTFYHLRTWSLNLTEYLLNRKQLGIPSIESISRVRRKIQAEDESLRGSKRKQKVRLEAQLDFIEYATEKGDDR